MKGHDKVTEQEPSQEHMHYAGVVVTSIFNRIP